MRPLPISAETAQKLAAFMNVPLEHLMHMPQHLMLQKLSEMATADAADKPPTASPDNKE
jgi:tRNA A37 threonylcarbamoyltransferase TsaD